MTRRIFFLVTLAAFLPLGIALGKEPPAEQDQYKTVKLILHPAPLPRPALKYPLLPPKFLCRPGNAALEYDRIPIGRKLFNQDPLEETMCDYCELPLAELRTEKVRKNIARYRGVIADLQRAARLETCDWQIPFHKLPSWEIPVIDVSQIRRYMRFLAPAIRLQIADRKFDEALINMQTGFAMSLHAAQGPMFSHGLVGMAITRFQMSQCILDWIQQPGTPNLYWSLAALPHPFVNYQKAAAYEREWLYFTFPELYELEKKNYTAKEWRELYESFCRSMRKFQAYFMARPQTVSSFDPADVEKTAYNPAKKFLIERGHTAAEVEAMTAPQVILLAVVRNYEELRDDAYNLFNLPYSEENTRRLQTEFNGEQLHKKEILPLASLDLPGLAALKVGEGIAERELTMLRVLEAIRMYGASHDGRLPERLEDITEVPVPDDPLHGRPFIYRRDSDAAYLESPPPEGMSRELLGRQFLIQFAPKGNKSKAKSEKETMR